jgi:hypothetical protein
MYENGDSFARGFQVCLELAHRLKRVPTTQEVLDYLRANGLFTGRWEENEQKRAGRITYNLDYLRRTFDPAKLSRSTGGDLASIDLFEYRRWADRHYPTGIEAATVDEVNVFLAITKFCLVTDPNEDGTLPYQRFKAIWELLYKSGRVKRQFRWERFVQIRNRLEQDDVVVISGEPSPGKAQKWRVGRSFPNFPQMYSESEYHPFSADSSSASGEERGGRKSYLTLCLQRLTPYFHQMAFMASELVHQASFGFWRRE